MTSSISFLSTSLPAPECPRQIERRRLGKKLEKPSLAAWAVNQLYWRQRQIYDELIKTSGQVRTAHKQLLAGKSADVRAPEVFHGEAMRKSKEAIRVMLEAAGHSSSDGVMTPITETLDALPTMDPPGG